MEDEFNFSLKPSKDMWENVFVVVERERSDGIVEWENFELFQDLLAVYTRTFIFESFRIFIDRVSKNLKYFFCSI